jgi:hypothetical protein
MRSVTYALLSSSFCSVRMPGKASHWASGWRHVNLHIINSSKYSTYTYAMYSNTSLFSLVPRATIPQNNTLHTACSDVVMHSFLELKHPISESSILPANRVRGASLQDRFIMRPLHALSHGPLGRDVVLCSRMAATVDDPQGAAA